MLRKLLKLNNFVKATSTHEFNYAMEFAQETLEEESKKENKILILNYMLDVIREDLKSDLLSQIFYCEKYSSKKINFPFPYNFYNKEGEELNFSPEEEKIKVDLAENCVLVLPWHRKRMRDNIKNIYRNEFMFDKQNHLAYFFTHIDICYVYNGNHSIASGIVFKRGCIEAKKYDVSKLFKHVYTDGSSWYNSHNDKKIAKLFDFRIGIIYEISKLKYELEIT